MEIPIRLDVRIGGSPHVGLSHGKDAHFHSHQALPSRLFHNRPTNERGAKSDGFSGGDNTHKACHGDGRS